MSKLRYFTPTFLFNIIIGDTIRQIIDAISDILKDRKRRFSSKLDY